MNLGRGIVNKLKLEKEMQIEKEKLIGKKEENKEFGVKKKESLIGMQTSSQNQMRNSKN